MNTPESVRLDFESVIVGAGISGIGAAIDLKREGLGDFVLLEKSDTFGGTWRDNTYPGVAVDIPSISYSFSYELHHPWSRVYAPGAEIQDYMGRCIEKYGIKEHIRYNAAVDRTEFDRETHSWLTTLTNGSQLRSRYIIAATGLLNQPIRPEIEGLETFEGEMMHTAEWDHTVELRGKRVGIIGTGASAVQVVPAIAPEVAHLDVYQRTPIWVGPRPDGPLDPHAKSSLRNLPGLRRVARFFSECMLELGTFAVVNYQRTRSLVKRVEAAQSAYIRRAVEDPDLHAKLTPAYGFGCKRPAFSNDYLQSFNRENVDLITEPIERITPKGIVTSDGDEHPLDILILGTGFKTMERGNAPSFDVVGLDAVELGEFWHENRYQAFSGVSVPRYPNLFLTSSPYSGGLNWFTMLEAHLKYITRCMKKARARGATYVEVKQSAHDRYFEYMLERAEGTVFKDAACLRSNSYYIDHHGDASLPFPHAPLWRWFRVRFSSLDVYRFSPDPET